MGMLLYKKRLKAIAEAKEQAQAEEAKEVKSLASLTVSELKAIAESKGIEVPTSAKKADIIALLEAGGESHGDNEKTD